MDIEIQRETCPTCKVVFWITDTHQKRLQKSKESFYCPNGHSQSYQGETDKEKLERVERELAQEQDYSGILSRSNSALRGVVTKMKNTASEL